MMAVNWVDSLVGLMAERLVVQRVVKMAVYWEMPMVAMKVEMKAVL